MERDGTTLSAEPLELGVASELTLGNFGFIPEKEVTMHLGISDE